MPEPPKITTSLADRIARLNATQRSLDRNHATEKKETGEIKSKISKYEATGQYEAPLIPKGSFGLGAPLAKPDRGLDRIRIASLGVSGGMTLNKSIHSDPSIRSVSLGRPPTKDLSSTSVDLGTPDHQSTATITPPSSSLAPHPHSPSHSPHRNTALNSSSSSIINQSTTPQDDHHEPSDSSPRHSLDSNQVYEGILDAYPTTPADEDSQSMVTCSNCLKHVELELLADHLCQLSVQSSGVNGLDNDPSLEESREEFPVDVPESPVHHVGDHPKQESESPSKLSTEPGTTALSTNQVVATSPPLEEPQVTQASSQLVIDDEENAKQASVGDESKNESTSTGSSKKHRIEAKRSNNRSNDSFTSNSTNTTNRMSGSNRPDFRGSSPIYHNWHDDDDDDDNIDPNGATGFVTIVRSSSRFRE